MPERRPCALKGFRALNKVFLYKVPADESGGEMVESFEDVGASLVADGQPAEAAEPGQGVLYYPAMAPQALAALDAAPCDPVADPSPAQDTTAARQIIGFVGGELGWALARPSRPWRTGGTASISSSKTRLS
jgi:hypothetical protein